MAKRHRSEKWFDQGWQARGWPFHWYYQGSAHQVTAPNRSSSHYITHLCNYSVTPDVGYGIYHSLHDDYLYPYTALVASNTMIFQGQRSVLTAANESGDYRAVAEMYQAYSGNYELGASAQ